MVFRLALGQIEARVGDLDGNAARLLAAWRRAAGLGADLVVLPRHAVTGSPPGDLLRSRAFVSRATAVLDQLAAEGPAGTAAVLGHVAVGAASGPEGDVPLTQAIPGDDLVVLADGQVLHGSAAGDRSTTGRVTLRGVRVSMVAGALLDADATHLGADEASGVHLLVQLDAAPYMRGGPFARQRRAAEIATSAGIHVASCNPVGGQDEVVFDGASVVVGPDGTVLARGAQFEEDLVVVDLAVGVDDASAALPALPVDPLPALLDGPAEVWGALVRATRDYCLRNGFRQALVGLSGGIDSAVVAVLAADALGAENLTGVAMPSPYSSPHSVADALALARNLGCDYLELPIHEPLAAFGHLLDGLVVTGFERTDGAHAGVAYENLQSRLRGVTLMTLSNERRAIVLTTGNRSEYAVGYGTLYGDMAGGFAPLRDVSKLLVYELARWRNRDGAPIPVATIDKPPSAELRPGQLDRDSLPDYEVLDPIVAAAVEDELDLEQIVERGHDRATVQRVLAMIDRAEFKRQQAAPGPRITRRGFDRDRRMPITSGWRHPPVPGTDHGTVGP